MTLPNFLVIGAQRAGTSLLHAILDHHPEVYVPQQRKEIHFFDLYHARGSAWYEGYFPRPDAAQRYTAIGEVTPDYLAVPEAPARIHGLLPAVRLVAILRNPVERAWSWYQHARRGRYEQRPFERFLSEDGMVREAGFYHRNLCRFLEFFPREQLHVMIYEELVADPSPELERLAAFLHLKQSWDDGPRLLETRVNTSAIPRYRRAYAAARNFGKFLMCHDLNAPGRIAKRLGVHRVFGRATTPPRLAPEQRAQLAAIYRDDARRLAALLGREQPIWRLEPAS